MYDKTVPIPQHLQEIGKSFNYWKTDTVPVTRSSLPNLRMLGSSPLLSSFYDDRDLLKVVREAFSGFATYYSTTPSTTVIIDLRFSPKGYE